VAAYLASQAILSVTIDCLKRTPVKVDQGINDRKRQSKQVLSIYITKPTANPMLNEKGAKDIDNPGVVVATLARNNLDNQSEEVQDSDHLLKAVHSLHPQLSVNVYAPHHRPDMAQVIQQAVASFDSDMNRVKNKTVVVCCGPAELLDSVRSISRDLDCVYQGEAFNW
jgi:hypothetical protein